MNLSGLEDISEVFLESFCLASWEIAKGLFHLRSQELKYNLGQDAVVSLPEVWTA